VVTAEKVWLRRPHSPLGSAAVIAILAAITLSRRTFHSSGVKFDLSVTNLTSLTGAYSHAAKLSLRLVTFAIMLKWHVTSVTSGRTLWFRQELHHNDMSYCCCREISSAIGLHTMSAEQSLKA